MKHRLPRRPEEPARSVRPTPVILRKPARSVRQPKDRFPAKAVDLPDIADERNDFSECWGPLALPSPHMLELFSIGSARAPEYCGLDTLSMVLVVEHWRRATGLA